MLDGCYLFRISTPTVSAFGLLIKQAHLLCGWTEHHALIGSVDWSGSAVLIQLALRAQSDEAGKHEQKHLRLLGQADPLLTMMVGDSPDIPGSVVQLHLQRLSEPLRTVAWPRNR